jgi:uncharacterized protein YjiS (DUF1127 family)
MTHFTRSTIDSEQAQFGWVAGAILDNAMEAVSHFIALMKQAAAREKGRRQIAELDAHLLRDIGLDPFDRHDGRFRFKS